MRKLPRGTKRSPWYYQPQRLENGKTIEACFYHFSRNGIWKVPKLPVNHIVEIMSSY